MSTRSDDSDDSEYGMELHKYPEEFDSTRRESMTKTMLESHILNSIEYSEAEYGKPIEDGWSRYMDEESGYAYFHNSGTGESKWEEDNEYHSLSDNILEIGADKHYKTNGWVEVIDENGNTYYYNKVRFITVQCRKVFLRNSSIFDLNLNLIDRDGAFVPKRVNHIPKLTFLSSFYLL